jgi:hypothetical protein
VTWQFVINQTSLFHNLKTYLPTKYFQGLDPDGLVGQMYFLWHTRSSQNIFFQSHSLKKHNTNTSYGFLCSRFFCNFFPQFCQSAFTNLYFSVHVTLTFLHMQTFVSDFGNVTFSACCHVNYQVTVNAVNQVSDFFKYI